MFKPILTAGLLIAATGFVQPALAANCAQRDVVVERLESKYSERLTAGGLQTSKSIMEVWASDETGTFTVILTHPSGLSCIVASGTHWYVDESAPQPTGTAS